MTSTTIPHVYVYLQSPFYYDFQFKSDLCEENSGCALIRRVLSKQRASPHSSFMTAVFFWTEMMLQQTECVRKWCWKKIKDKSRRPVAAEVMEKRAQVVNNVKVTPEFKKSLRCCFMQEERRREKLTYAWRTCFSRGLVHVWCSDKRECGT